jgi:hypothetical protein
LYISIDDIQYNNTKYSIVESNSFLFYYSFFLDKSINIQYERGCDFSGEDQSGFAAAIELARSADIVVFYWWITSRD